MADQRLLIAFAHPDDESFGLGSLIAKYVAEGVDVYYICATDGDVGTIPEEMQGQYDSIRDLRLAELDCASKILGFKQVFKFGYKDSGMMGDESNQDPDCLWYNHENHPQQVERRVVEVIREIQPQVVITFNKYGGYGHPDHIAIQRATEKAFELAGREDYIAEGLPPYQPQKLYYNAFPTLLLRFFLFIIRLRGKDPRKMGVNEDIDFIKIMENVEPVHTRVNVAKYFDIGDAASACHKSQGGGSQSIPFAKWFRRLLTRKQGLTRIHPKPLVDHVGEDDLFKGVTPEPIQVAMP